MTTLATRTAELCAMSPCEESRAPVRAIWALGLTISEFAWRAATGRLNLAGLRMALVDRFDLDPFQPFGPQLVELGMLNHAEGRWIDLLLAEP